jgi:RNA 3'-terminal phosphate cyclase (ATP)
MVNQCVANLKQEVQDIDKSRERTAKGCLDTFMRDQVVVFEALGKLGVTENVIGHNDSPGDGAGDEELSLHTRTAMWVCEQILGVRV